MLEYIEIFIVNLIIPAVMLFGGYMMKTCPPRNISRWVGFRTALGYLGVCACVLRAGMVESRMDFTGTVCAWAAAIREGRRGNARDACAGDGACAVLHAARNSGVRAERTKVDV